MKKYLLTLVASLMVVCAAHATSQVTLAWDASPGTNVIATYKVYYGVASGTYTNAVSAGTNLSVTISNVVDRMTYYFAATAVDTSGLESAFSNEISYWVNPIKNVVPTITVTRNGLPRIVAQLYPNAPVQIWIKSSLVETQWTPLKRINASGTGVLVFTDRDAVTNHLQRYYKVEVTL